MPSIPLTSPTPFGVGNETLRWGMDPMAINACWLGRPSTASYCEGALITSPDPGVCGDVYQGFGRSLDSVGLTAKPCFKTTHRTTTASRGLKALKQIVRQRPLRRKNACMEILSLGGSRIYERTSKTKKEFKEVHYWEKGWSRLACWERGSFRTTFFSQIASDHSTMN